ncbi:hypothetical protein AcV5_008631 [Taiwanofungus camphoratus]|nr:hypothetical protein AcV5_008631 [Antrodia cinnamomea]
MSCSLCRLPFTPSPRSTQPHLPPPGALTDKQHNYFQWAVAMGIMVPGACTTFEYLDNNMFGNKPTIPLVISMQWETDGGTIVTLHTVCASILRHLFGATDYSVDSVTALCEIERVLGRPQGGPTAGRFSGVDYEGVGAEKVDLRPFWKPDEGEGNTFLWSALKSQGLEWTLTRPDVFPRFHPSVSPARLAALGPNPETTTDILTTQPLDVLQVILPYLTDRSFVALLSTCRLLRRHALTTFQPHARDRVLALGWAVPVESEYARLAKTWAKDGRSEVPVAHEVHSPYDSDWYLYLSQVHRTTSMHARRWIWAIAEELLRAYTEKKVGSEYEDTIAEDGTKKKTTKRMDLEQSVRAMNGITCMLNGQEPSAE